MALGGGGSIFGAIGAGLNLIGGLNAASNQRAAGKYQAQVHRENAIIARDFGKYNAEVATNNAAQARQNKELAGKYGQFNADIVQQKADQSRHNARSLRKNIDLIRTQQDRVVRESTLRVQERRRDTRQVVGEQRAALAANGVVVDQGSAARLVASSHRIGREDEVQILSDADADLFDLEIEAINFENQAQSVDRQAEIYESEVDGILFQAAVRQYELENEAINFENEAVFAMHKAEVQAYNFEHDAVLAEKYGSMTANAQTISTIASTLNSLHGMFA